ncbi:MAG TPA: energy transducer TonB [Rhizomicrobium sp.]|nr:energy transducer TonB [Rhizomicrobium sp.]
MTYAASVPLSEFPRRSLPARADPSSRVTAGLLTAILYALFVLLVWWSSTNTTTSHATAEISATILRDMPNKRAVEPLPPILAHLIRPHAEKPALPVFTVATGAPPQALAPLPASAAQTSPMPGGTAGTGPMGQAASGNGTGGNGGSLAGCLDPLWMHAVTERVRQFFYYPGAALAVHTTGVVTMHFTVRRNGQIDRLKISKSSGDDGLDKAATDIMQKAQPLPPIPDRMRTDRVDGELPINFGVRSFNGSATTGHCGG